MFLSCMARSGHFYGTPLIRFLKDEGADSESTYKKRKTRLDYQQTVRDKDGRQRFHGAFTGGFSAGYYNTVDSVQGFTPKEFISHRSDRYGAPNVSHRPEDYMDEEDHGEFGIAPKKIRVKNHYSSCEPSIQANMKHDSIGVKILKSLSTQSTRFSSELFGKSSSLPPIKNDYHGLGYNSLKIPVNEAIDSDPLIATFKQGKRIKISGEAFGSGVLEDDDDDYYIHAGGSYNYDSIKNYNFDRHSRPASSSKGQSSLGDDNADELDLYSSLARFRLKSCNSPGPSDVMISYPEPIVPEDWTMPVRKEPQKPLAKKELYLQRLKTEDTLINKFTSATETSGPDDYIHKAGLLQYSDMKPFESTSKQDNLSSCEPVTENISILRQNLDWRPCSLLCKRFNVPNPYPDSQFVGTRPDDLLLTKKYEDINSGVQDDIAFVAAPKELRKSIFNVIDDVPRENEQDPPSVSSDEDAAQVVILNESDYKPEPEGPDHTTEPEIIVVPVCPKQPEVITLSSSSSSCSPTNEHNIILIADDECDQEIYGPPLPPNSTSIARISIDRKSKSKKSKKKKKKHKRNK